MLTSNCWRKRFQMDCVWNTNATASFVKCFGMRAAKERWCMWWFIAGDRVNVLSGTRLRVSGELKPDTEWRINEVCCVMWAFKPRELQDSAAAAANRCSLLCIHSFLHGFAVIFGAAARSGARCRLCTRRRSLSAASSLQLASCFLTLLSIHHCPLVWWVQGAWTAQQGDGTGLMYDTFVTQKDAKKIYWNLNSWVGCIGVTGVVELLE